MSAALELIEVVRANGGRMRVEGASLVIAPDTAGLPILDELRQHKEEIIRLLENSITVDDPDEWRAPWVKWLDSTCRSQTIFSASLKKLHDSYCDWEIARNGVSCSLATFERLLEECGFLVVCYKGVRLVDGLELKEDIRAHEEFQAFLKLRGTEE